MNHESLSFNKQSNLSDNSVKIKKITLSSHCSINRCMVFEAAGAKAGLRLANALWFVINHSCSSVYTVHRKKSPR